MDISKKLNNILPQIIFCLTALMFSIPIIPRAVKPIIVALYLVGAIYSMIISNEKFKWKYFLLSSSIFFIYALSLLYSDNLSYGLRKLETASYFIAFPLIMSLMSKRCLSYILERRYQLMWFFIIATFVLNIAAFLFFFQQYSFKEVTIHFINIIRSDISGYKIHPIYLSMHIGIAMIFSLFLVYKGLKINRLIILTFINIVLIFFMLIMIKKGPIIALMLVAAYLIIVFKNTKLYIVFALSVIGLIAVIIINPKVNERFSELLQVQNTDTSMTNSTNIRYSIYQCVSKVFPDAGIMGYGIGDGKDKLIDCYEENDKLLAISKYNSHNQFLGLVLNVGYLGLLCFSIFLLYYLIRGFYKKNYLLIVVILFYSIVMFSENILERENGILYFSFFVNFFIMLDHNFKNPELKSTINHKGSF